MKRILSIAVITGLAHFAFSQNFGIDVPSPTEKLDVNGNARARGYVLSEGVKNVSGTVSTYSVTTRRYYIKGTYGADGGRTIPLDMNIVADLCGDEDGCRVRFIMRYWGGVESEGASDGNGQTGSYLFTYDISNGRWRWGGANGVDGNGTTEHALSIFSGACYFTDGNYSGFSGLGDPAGRQMGLLIWNGAYTNAARTCELTLED